MDTAKIAILLSFLVLVSFTYIFADQPIQVDLNSAINLAIAHNETYQIAIKEVEKADGQVMEAISGALPQLTGGFTYLRNWEIPVGVFQMDDEIVTFKFGSEHSYSANLTLTQPIYSGGKTFVAWRLAKMYKKLTKEMLRKSTQDLIVEVYNGFYGARLAIEVLRVNEEARQLADENLDVVSKLYAQGMVAEFDFLRAKVEVANLQPEVIKARSNATVAMNSLKNLLGISQETLIELNLEYDSTAFIIPPIDPVVGESEVLANRSEILMSQYEVNMRKQAISLEKAGYRPSLYFTTSLQYQTQFNQGNPFDRSWDRSISSMILLDVPIFDSWKTPSRVKQAKLEWKQSELKSDAIRKGMVLAYQQSYGNYLESRNRLSAQGDAVALAKRGLDIAKVRYESGVGTQLELSDARLALSRAEINKAVAFHDLAVSYAAMIRALGRDFYIAKE